MNDELEWVLARVASGELTPDEADPIVAALSERPARPAPAAAEDPTDGPGTDADPIARDEAMGGGPARVVRVLVMDGGRQVVNLRIPMSLASLAGAAIPGLPEAQVARLQQAIRDGRQGTILNVRDPDGSGVLIATE